MHLGCSSWTWTGIWDDVRNPLSDVISNSVLGRSNSVFPRYNYLRVFYQRKTEFDLLKTEFEMTSLRGFLTSSQIPVHVQLLHPRCITDSQKGYIILHINLIKKILIKSKMRYLKVQKMSKFIILIIFHKK